MSVPEVVDDEETILRCAMHPMNFHKKRREIVKNILKPPAGSDCVSVLRLDYSTREKCIAHCNCIGSPGRTFAGFLSLVVETVRSCQGADVISTPMEACCKLLEEHADIRYPFVVVRGEPLANSDQKIIDCIFEKVKGQFQAHNPT